MKARVNKVLEPITIAISKGGCNNVIKLNIGDIIEYNLGDYYYSKNNTVTNIPSELMDLIETEPCPSLSIDYKFNDNHSLMLFISDWKHFTSQEIVDNVKSLIDNLEQ
jgi:hypothetical protein